MISSNRGLGKYIWRLSASHRNIEGDRFNRRKLNAMMGLGLLVIGSYALMVCYSLIGWVGVVLFFSFFPIGIFFFLEVLGIYAIIPILLSYAAIWLFANIVLSRYVRLAKQRVKEIEGEESSESDRILEKGVLLYYVLQEDSTALKAFELALSMQAGSASLWYVTGITLGRMRMDPKALEAFDRAGMASPDKKLTRKIGKAREFIQKRRPEKI